MSLSNIIDMSRPFDVKPLQADTRTNTTEAEALVLAAVVVEHEADVHYWAARSRAADLRLRANELGLSAREIANRHIPEMSTKAVNRELEKARDRRDRGMATYGWAPYDWSEDPGDDYFVEGQFSEEE